MGHGVVARDPRVTPRGFLSQDEPSSPSRAVRPTTDAWAARTCLAAPGAGPGARTDPEADNFGGP